MLRLSRILVLASLVCLPLSSFGKKQTLDFDKNFRILERNFVVYNAYDDSIHKKMDDAMWVGMMERRGKCFRRIYHENNKAIAEIEDYFKTSGKKRIPDAAYDSLYVHVNRVFNQYTLDNFLVEEFAQILLPYYEAKGLSDELVNLRHIIGLCNTEISRFMDKDAGKTAKQCFIANINLIDSDKPLTPMMKYILPLDFMNYCYTLPSLEFVSPSEAYKGIKKFEKFIAQNKDGVPEEVHKRWQSFLNRIYSYSSVIYQSYKDKTPEDSLVMHKMDEYSPYQSITINDLKDAQDSVNYFYNKTVLAQMDIYTADSLTDITINKELDKLKLLNSPSEFDIQSLSNMISLSIAIMEENDRLSEEEKIRRTTDRCNSLVELVQRVHIIKDPFFLESMLGHLACSKNTFRHLRTEDKIQYMNELAVKAQIGTIIHVDVVKELTMVMFDGLVKHCPEQFVGVLGLNSAEDVLARKDELREWIGTAAAYHDIGKIGMSPIFRDEFRRLTDREFHLSRMHPELALRYLNVDPVFDQFKDVAMGHHKWHDGKGGYPDSFDNTKSPWHSYIDLVTLCDCIDAATDNINRNYRTPKTLAEVLVEFKQEAGTRYNPVMVEALCNDAELCKQIEDLIKNQRKVLVNKVRNQYIR